MRIRFAIVPVMATAVAIGGSLATAAAPTRAAFPGSDGRIVFVDIQDGADAVIYSMSDVGDDVQQLTTEVESPYGDLDPSWSPGGTLIVFTRYTAAGTGEIWRMNADGSGQKRLTTNASDDILPTFSADGARIAFSTDRNGNYDIYTMDPDGGDLTRLTSHEAHDLDPAWSPDNTRIAFSSDRRQSEDDRYWFEVHTMAATGPAALARETNGSTVLAHDFSPDWHPYVNQLTFTRTSGPDDSDIMFVDVASNAITARTTSVDLESAAVYGSSQGEIVGDLLWEQSIAGDWDIARAARVGTDPAYLTFAVEGDQLQPDSQPRPIFPLIDWRFSPFENDIEFIYDAGITGGCTAERYCPHADVTRAQMAIFLDRTFELAPTTTDFFSDDDGRTGEASINRVAAAGITGGCGGGKYCPTAPVTRGQMAAFLARAFDLPATATDYFTDDETSTFESSINRVAAAGITGGCGGGRYCPSKNVTRGQMAAFLHRALQ